MQGENGRRTIIGMDQIEERSQQQSKRQKQETSKKHINKEQTQAILFCFFVACEGTVNYYLQPGVSRKHHKDSDFYRSPHHWNLQAVVNSRTVCNFFIFDMDNLTIQPLVLLRLFLVVDSS